jgi:hypothetical protein
MAVPSPTRSRRYSPTAGSHLFRKIQSTYLMVMPSRFTLLALVDELSLVVARRLKARLLRIQSATPAA